MKRDASAQEEQMTHETGTELKGGTPDSARRHAMSESHFQLLAGHVTDVVWALDLTTHTFTHVSPSVETMLGFTQEEYLRLSVAEVLDEDGVRRFLEEMPDRIERFTRHGVETSIDEVGLRHRDGHIVWGEISSRFVVDESTGSLLVFGVTRNIDDRRKLDDARHFLMRCGYSPDGRDFFEEAAAYLARALGMDYVCIDVLEGDRCSARPLAMWLDGPVADPQPYDLKGTPCGEVAGRAQWCQTKGLRARFPGNAVLEDIQAESYIGVTLFNARGIPIGLIAVMGRRELTNPWFAERILGIASIRTAGEMERRIAEAALDASEQLHRTLLATAPDPILITDAEGAIRFLSLAGLTFLELPDCTSLVGRSMMEFVHPEDQVMVMANVKALCSGDVLPPTRYRVVLPGGRELPVEANGGRISDGMGRITGLVFIIRDITERLRAEEEMRMARERFELLFNTSPDITIVSRAEDGLILEVNDRFTEISGYAKEEVIGRRSSDIRLWLHKENRKELVQSLLRDGYISNFDLLVQTKGGLVISGSMSARLFRYRGETCILSMTRDVGELRRTEEALQRKNEELNQANIEKDKFFSIVAHDLKSPFTALLGFTEMMADGLHSMTVEQLQMIAISLRKSATSLYRLLENLLEWSRLQRSVMEFRPVAFALQPHVHEALAILIEMARLKEIDFTIVVDHDDMVVLDRSMLSSILRNLASNAIKFTRRGGQVHLRASVNEQHLTITVSDNGIGMSPEASEALFTLNSPWSREGTEGEPSTGLGLILCREFVERHGGRINIRSTEGEGSTFTVALPLPTHTTH